MKLGFLSIWSLGIKAKESPEGLPLATAPRHEECNACGLRGV